MAHMGNGVADLRQCVNQEEYFEQIITNIYANTATQEQRREAHQALERLRESCDNPASLGLVVCMRHMGTGGKASDWMSVMIQHSALSLVEHAVRYKWTKLDAQTRLDIKKSCFHIVSASSKNTWPKPIEQVLCRCVVEMVKHMWPQNWPNFLEECDVLQQTGEHQYAFVLNVWMRLVQDVATMCTIDVGTRKKELNNAIAMCMPQWLEECCNAITKAQHMPDLMCVALQLVAELVEMANMSALAPYLQQIVCLTSARLNDPVTRRLAAIVLWQLAARKSQKPDEQRAVNALLGKDCITAVLTAAKAASDTIDNEQYAFLKELCGILSALGHHLCILSNQNSKSGSDDGSFRMPDMMSSYIHAIIAFFQHPSLRLRDEASALLGAFINNPVLSKCLVDVVPDYLDLIPNAILKPDLNNPLMGKFVEMDYDEPATEIHNEIMPIRARCSRMVVDSIALLGWKRVFGLCEHWIKQRVLGTPDQVPADEWDAMNKLMKVAFGAFNEHAERDQILAEAVPLFDAVLQLCLNQQNLIITNYAMSTLSALFVILHLYPAKLIDFLTLTKRVLSMNASCPELLKTPSHLEPVLSVQRHVLSGLLRTCSDFSAVCLPHSQAIFELAQSILQQGHLSLMQQAQLLQSLTVLSNHFTDPNQQYTFLEATFKASVEYFVNMNIVLSDPVRLLAYWGLDQQAPTNEQASTSQAVANRKLIRGHINLLDGILMQLRVFDVSNPNVYSLLAPALPALFAFLRTLALFHTPSVGRLIHESYGGPLATDLPEVEKKAVTVMIADPSEQATDKAETENQAEIFRVYFNHMLDRTQNVCGLLMLRFPVDFFMEVSSASQYLQYAVVETLPAWSDYRLRFMIKRIWRNLVLATESSPTNMVLVQPFIASFITHMWAVLEPKWQEIMDRMRSATNGTATDEEQDEPTSAQMFADDCVCMLSREYVALVQTIMLTHKTDSNRTKPSLEQNNDLSQWGKSVMNDDMAMPSLVQFVFNAISWPDTQCSQRAGTLLIPTLQHLIDAQKVDIDSGKQLLYLTLKCLQTHGHDEMQCGVFLTYLCQIYILLLKCVPEVRDLMKEIPEYDAQAHQQLDNHVMNPHHAQMPDKARRDMMKRVVKGLIGPSLSERFKQPVQHNSLPPLLKPPKRQQRSIMDEPGTDNQLSGLPL